MKKLSLLLLLTFTLFAQNPHSFDTLGDVIYDDADKFENLKDLQAMHDLKKPISEYIKLAKTTKKLGFSVDEKKGDAKVYLKSLRQLSLKHDKIILSIRKLFSEAIHDEDSHTVNMMVKYDVIDIVEHEKELLNYYEEFNEDHNLSALDNMYAQHLVNVGKENNSSKKHNSQNRQTVDEATLARIRASRRQKQEALEKSVRQEQEREKKRVLKEQKEALGLE